MVEAERELNVEGNDDGGEGAGASRARMGA